MIALVIVLIFLGIPALLLMWPDHYNGAGIPFRFLFVAGIYLWALVIFPALVLARIY